MNAPQQRIRLILGIAAFLMVAALNARVSVPQDFRAFYCAGAAVNIGADPYRVEPLRTCERSGNIRGNSVAHGFAIPAPLPGYALAPFTLLAKLPYENAAVLWRVLLWAAVAVTILALRSLTGMEPLVLIAALLFASYPAATGGNIAPFAIAGAASGAWFASRRRYAPATLCVVFAMWDPHLGLGALLALAIFAPPARLFAALGVCALGALTYATTGLVWTKEYIRDVIPAHILSEVAHEKQFSLTHAAHLLGASDKTAIALGDLSYLLALLCGVVVAGRLRNILRDDACLVLVPVAFTVIGGPFMHITQIAVAVPAALFLRARVPALARPLSWAVLLLAVPWVEAATLQIVEPFVLLGFGFLAWSLLENRRAAALAVIAAAAILPFIASLPTTMPVPSITVPPDALSEDAWKPIVETMMHPTWFFPFQLLTWAGLLIVAWAAVKAARPHPAGSL